MSDKIIRSSHSTITQKDTRDAAGIRSPSPINARLQWVADLVCAILDAESHPGCGEHQTVIVNGE